MSLPTLPFDLLLEITMLLGRFRDLNALTQTNKLLYLKLNSHLYFLDVQVTGGSVLVWAAQQGFRRTAWLSLAEGANIEALSEVRLPNPLRRLGFGSPSAHLTPLQVALCYGSDSVARLLISRGSISSSLYPPELLNCTNIHMAAAMGLISTMKILIAQGMHIEARDTQLRTALHYAVIMSHREPQEQARVVVWLLSNNADLWAKDSQGRSSISIGKKRSNLIVKMLFRKGAVIEAYETSLQDQELFRFWKGRHEEERQALERQEMERQEEERREEAAWTAQRIEKQFAIKCARRERYLEELREEGAAAERRVATRESREQEEPERRGNVHKVAQGYAVERDNKLVAPHKIFVKEARTEKPQLGRHDNARENWSRMRKAADQRSRMATDVDLPAKPDCRHLSGMWKCKARKTCQSCGISTKSLSFCTDCGFVICMRCNSGKLQRHECLSYSHKSQLILDG
jgi:hypothetical protein